MQHTFSLAINYYGQAHFIRAAFDAMQPALRCCGSSGFTDWLRVPWSDDPNFLAGRTVGFPTSCCSPPGNSCGSWAPKPDALSNAHFKHGCSRALARVFG
jgi:hypothetical protein